MSSFRKKYHPQLESDDEPPVMPPPADAAKLLPEAVADTTLPEPLDETKSPADQAAESELRKRLSEMERAESLQRQQRPQPTPQAEEPREPTVEETIAALHPRVQAWCRKDPELLTNPEKIAKATYCHHVAAREVGEEGTPAYYDRMEQMLGFGNARPTPPPAARNVEPQRQPLRPMSAPVSAPPTREVPSMTTGRAPRYRAPLTRDELEIAAACGQTPEQYEMQKLKMLKMKEAGEIQG